MDKEKMTTIDNAVEKGERIGTDDAVNPHLLTAGRDSTGAFIYPFIDCDELCADQPAGQALVGFILHNPKKKA